uniref:Uncharacterized protein n=1 Tax=Solibacter usitatus (strain Ellin6076) TaxID=234267 RepID=Q021Z3_SOLUE
MRSQTLGILAILTASCTAGFGAAKTTHLTFRGTGSIHSTKASGAETSFETRQGPSVDAAFNKQIAGTVSPARVPADHVPKPATASIGAAGSGFSGFQGISHLDQRLAANGNQFSTEPPDQALAIGNGLVLESVNLAIAVYNTAGTQLGITSLNEFFGLPDAIVRGTTPVYGPFLSDPRAYFDAPTNRWFVTILEIDTNPVTGDLLGHSSVMIAVSQTPSPLGAFNIYALDTTNVSHPGCPCFGDQPLIGADKYGFYVTTNEFPITGDGFNGAQIYAVSKTALENSLPAVVVAFEGPALAEGISYSVQPATTPPGGSFEGLNGGTEYFMSALDFNSTLDNRIAVWALTNTQSLNSTTPSVQLQNVIVSSQVYGLPPAMQQKPGPTPLADLLKVKGNPLGVVTNEHLELIDGDDDRMQQVVFAAGSLWTSLGTVVKPPNGPVRVGAAWFIVTPSWSGGTLGAAMTNQGYVAANQNNLAYPAIGVNSLGKGVMTFTLAGPDYFPSAAFATLDKVNGAGSIQIAAPGAGPDDGFTGYGAFGGRVGRWGDYAAAVADSDGSIWLAVEYIPGGPRTVLANWGTFVGRVMVH